MSQLPPPLTPPDCDLRGFENLQLDVELLPKSKLANYADPEAFRAAVLLWCAAWKEVPAASLPDDDLELRAIAKLQRDGELWERIKRDALHKFIKCSDGRLYHEVLSEKANKAWKARLEYRDRGKAGAKARAQAAATAAAQAAAEAPAEVKSRRNSSKLEGEGEGDLIQQDAELKNIALEFWKKYPHPSNRGSKSKVISKIGKLSPDDQQAAFDSLEVFKSVIAKTREKQKDYTPPMAETFVNGRRWEALLESCERIVSRETFGPLPEPDDETLTERWRALVYAVGTAKARSWLVTAGKPALETNCSGYILRCGGELQKQKIENDMRGTINAVLGKGEWRTEMVENP